MRGALFLHSFRAFFRGIIPADAGSTIVPRPKRSCNGDHPRGCGEHVWGAKHKTIATGSSPRMRGARDLVHMLAVRVGIIPADAGSTTSKAIR